MGHRGPARPRRLSHHGGQPAPVLPLLAAAHERMSLREEIEVFLYEEARLLDDWRLHEWLELFTDDIRYWMPNRETLPVAEKTIEPDDLAFGLYDEDKSALMLRVRRLDTGLAHVEEPRSVTRHMISNVLVGDAGKPGEVLAHSNFMVF